MQSKIDNFINDFYADLDSGEETKQFVAKYFETESVMCHYGEMFRNCFEIESWFDSFKAGFSDSVHQIKSVIYEEHGEIITLQADLVWTAAFRNIDGNNMIRYKTVTRMDLTEYCGKFTIKTYKSTAVK